jgi:hypothetical protein
MPPLHRSLLLHLEFKCDWEHIFCRKHTSGSSMDIISVDPQPAHAWRRLRRCLKRLLDQPTNGSKPYSPLFCLSLLLAIGLIIEISR